MAGMLDLLQGLQVQQAPDPRTQNWGMESFSNALSGLAAQMEQDKERKRLAAERERQLKAEQRKQDEGTVKFLMEAGQRARSQGNNETAKGILDQLRPLTQSLYGYSGPAIAGSPTGAYDVQTHKPLMNYDTAATGGALDSVFGENKGTTLAPGYSIARNGQIEVTAPYAPKIAGSPKTGYSIVDMNQGGASPMPAATGLSGPVPAARPSMVVPPAPVQPRSSGGGRRSGGGRGGRSSGGKPPAAASTGGAPVKPGTVNSVLSTVDKMKSSVAERHTKGRNTDWAAVDKEWRPRAEAYLRRNGMNPDEYLPAPTKAAPAKPAAQQPAAQPQGNWLQRWFKSSDAPELTPQVASLLQEAGLFEDLG